MQETEGRASDKGRMRKQTLPLQGRQEIALEGFFGHVHA